MPSVHPWASAAVSVGDWKEPFRSVTGKIRAVGVIREGRQQFVLRCRRTGAEHECWNEYSWAKFQTMLCTVHPAGRTP